MKRSLIKNLWLFLAVIFSGFFLQSHADSQSYNTTIQGKFSALENSAGGRIGISVINTADNSRLQYRADERFPMCCTAKVMGVATVLKMSMTDKGLLQQRIFYKKSDLASWSPVTGQHVADGMTVSELCAAAIMYSDNTAMNILIKQMGGISVVDAFARSMGDYMYNLKHSFPYEAASIPGDLRDTTTPEAMANSLQRLLLGDILASPQRELLQTWMKNTKTGNLRIRAGVPAGWIVADKTGTGSGYGTTNDVAILWPPHHAPIVLVVYFTQNNKDAGKREDVVAAATRIVVSSLS